MRFLYSPARTVPRSLVVGVFAGIFDGHAGASCAQVVAKRLFHYMLAASLSPQQLSSLSTTFDEDNQLLEWYNNKYDFVDQLKTVYSNSFKRYVADLQAEGIVREVSHHILGIIIIFFF